MTADEIVQVAQNAGFSGDDLTTAVAVALAESSGNPNAFGDAGIGQGSFGLWQINSKYHPEYGPDFTVLYDPQTNANAAFAVYSQAGNSFSPWSTFKSGAYIRYAEAVANAISQAASEVAGVVEENPGSSIAILLAIGLAFLFLSSKS